MTEINKKYELIELTEQDLMICYVKSLTELGITLYRVKALRDFSDVKAGDIGGFIEKDNNLSHKGNCWVYDNAIVRDDAKVLDNAIVRDEAILKDTAMACENATVRDRVVYRGSASISGNNIERGSLSYYSDPSM
jgi:hypothetical protein